MALYRDYRPQKFAELVGHQAIKQTLQQALKEGKPAQSYLLVGPRGIGKTTLARLLAKSVNCQNFNAETGEPCLECAACQAVVAGNHLDVFEIDAASNRGIDDIRALKETVGLQPAQGKYKVYIIDEVHMLTKEAFNALLKTLEEPPPHLIFILATTEAHKVPATIISRCQRFDLRPASTVDTVAALERILAGEKRGAEPAALELLAIQAQGGHRDAASLLEQVLTHAEGDLTKEGARKALGLPDRQRVFEFMRLLGTSEVEAVLKEIAKVEADGINLQEFARLWLLTWRSLVYLFYTGSFETGKLTKEEGEALVGLKSVWPEGVLLEVLNGLIELSGDIKKSPLPLLPVELLALKALRLRGGAKNAQPLETRHSERLPARAAKAQSALGRCEESSLNMVSDIARDPSLPPGALDDEVKNVPAAPDSSVVVIPQGSSNPADTLNDEPKKEPGALKADTDPSPDSEEVWPRLLSAIKQENASLAALLRDATPGNLESVDNQTYGVLVKYPFHLKKLGEEANRRLIEAKLTELTGGPKLAIFTLKNGQNAEASVSAKPLPPEELDALVNQVFEIETP